MNDLLNHSIADNSLQKAFRRLREPANLMLTKEQFVERYACFFKPAPTTVQNNYFERFSLIDQNVQVVLTSNTQVVSK